MARNLDGYVDAVNRIPVLGVDEERALACRLRQHDDLEAARQLLLPHLRLVVAVARRYRGYGLPHADLIQEGNVGLMKALERFDPARGARFASFAIHWIRAEVHEFVLRNWRLVRVATTKAQRKLFFNLRSLKKHLGPLTSEEAARIAAQLGVKPDEVLEMEVRLYGQEIRIEGQHGEDVAASTSCLADHEGDPLRLLEARESEQPAAAVRKALKSLDMRSRHIVEARWLREGDAATLSVLGAQFKISAERIRQIEARALQKMRGALLDADRA